MNTKKPFLLPIAVALAAGALFTTTMTLAAKPAKTAAAPQPRLRRRLQPRLPARPLSPAARRCSRPRPGC